LLTRYAMIALGGALGALARYQVALSIQSRILSAFPWGTFVVNISGCFAMGAITSVLSQRIGLSENWRYLIPVGFIGAYTTFSTFELETYRAMTQGTSLVALMNIAASVVVGYAALWLGIITARLA
jgi:fluoride exporter